MFGRDKGSKRGGASPQEIYNGLRSTMLGAASSGQIPRHDDHPDVYGLVIDMPGQGGYATVVALGDNTTSMYTSTGGGIVGAGERPAVAASTQRLLTVLTRRKRLHACGGRTAFPHRPRLPKEGRQAQASPRRRYAPWAISR